MMAVLEIPVVDLPLLPLARALPAVRTTAVLPPSARMVVSQADLAPVVVSRADLAPAVASRVALVHRAVVSPVALTVVQDPREVPTVEVDTAVAVNHPICFKTPALWQGFLLGYKIPSLNLGLKAHSQFFSYYLQ